MMRPELVVHEKFSAEEQRDLVRRYRYEGDQKAKELLIRSNLRWVIQYARKFEESSDRLDDLVQAGAEGLCRAIEKYDLRKSTKFLSYAQFWIRAFMTETIERTFHPIRRDRNNVGRKISSNIHKARRQLQAQGRPESVENLARQIEVDQKDLKKWLAVDGLVRLDEPIMDGDKTRIDYLEGKPERLSQKVDAKKILRFVQEFGQQLDGRAADIWYNRTISLDPVVLSVFEDRWGVSKEAIRLHENKIKDQFTLELKRQHGIEFDWQGHGNSRLKR